MGGPGSEKGLGNFSLRDAQAQGGLSDPRVRHKGGKWRCGAPLPSTGVKKTIPGWTHLPGQGEKKIHKKIDPNAILRTFCKNLVKVLKSVGGKPEGINGLLGESWVPPKVVLDRWGVRSCLR